MRGYDKTFMMDPRPKTRVHEVTIEAAIEEFVENRRDRKLAESTVTWYDRRLRSTLELDLPRQITAFENPDFLTSIWKSVVRQHRTPETANGHLGALKAFLYWAVKRGYLTNVNPRRIEKVRVDVKMPKHISDDEMARLLATYDEGNIFELRDLTITSLMLDTGLRIGEALGLRVANFDPASNLLTITHTKGKRDRVVAMSPPMHRRMSEWHDLRTRMPETAGEFMFPSRESEQVSQRYFNTSLMRHAKAAGIPKRVSSHVLRFTYATGALNAGMRAEALQVALGHRHIAMSLYYARMHDATAHRESVAASPFARLSVERGRGMRGVSNRVA